MVCVHDKTLNQQCMLAQARPPMINHLTSSLWSTTQVKCSSIIESQTQVPFAIKEKHNRTNSVSSKEMQIPRLGEIPPLPPSCHFPSVTARSNLCTCVQESGGG